MKPPRSVIDEASQQRLKAGPSGWLFGLGSLGFIIQGFCGLGFQGFGLRILSPMARLKLKELLGFFGFGI